MTSPLNHLGVSNEAIAHARDMLKGHYPSHREYKVAEAFLALLDSVDGKPLYVSSPLPLDKIVSVTRAFDYEGNNVHTPWVKVSFPSGDWTSRDKFADALGKSSD